MHIEIWVCGLLILLMVGLMTAEIIMRYIFNNSIIWVQEFAIGEFIWIVALCGNIALMLRNHITIKTFSQFMTGKGKIYMNMLSNAFVFLAICYMLFNLPGSIHIQNRTHTSALPINFGKGVYYSVPLFLSAIIMAVTQVYYFYYQVLELMGKPVPSDYSLVWREREVQS